MAAAPSLGGHAPRGVEVAGAVEAGAPGAEGGGVLDQRGPVDGQRRARREFADQRHQPPALPSLSLGSFGISALAPESDWTYLPPMIKIIEAIVDERGAVRLLEPLHLDRRHRALVTILADETSDAHETALLSEAALAEDWNARGGRRMVTPTAGSVGGKGQSGMALR